MGGLHTTHSKYMYTLCLTVLLSYFVNDKKIH